MFSLTRFHIADKKLVQLAQILFISSICSVFFLKYNQESLPTNYLVVLNRIIKNVTHVSFFCFVVFRHGHFFANPFPFKYGRMCGRDSPASLLVTSCDQVLCF